MSDARKEFEAVLKPLGFLFDLDEGGHYQSWGAHCLEGLAR